MVKPDRWALPTDRKQKGTKWSVPKSRSLMLKLGYTLLGVTACSLILKASGYNPKASTPQELTAAALGGKNMDPFVKVQVCAPISVKVMPGPEHGVAVTADEAVKNAISTNVHEGTLSIELKHGFRTNNAIQVTVVVPNNQLELVNNRAPGSKTAIGPGFSVRRFTGVNGNNAGLYLHGFNADEVLLKNTGDGHIIARGDMRSVQIESAGTAKTYLKGGVRSVVAHLTGISEVHVHSSTEDLKIKGSIDMLSKVFYTRGRCDIGPGGQGLSGVGAAAAGGMGAFSGMQFGNMAAGMGNIFAGGCQKVESMRIPTVQHKWTCGLETVGRWTCSGMPSGSSSASASHSGNGQSFTSTGQGGAMSMSSSSGGSNRFSGSGDGNKQFMYSTDEGSVRSLSCNSNSAELRMFTQATTATS